MPVHRFLRHHVYLHLLRSYGMSKSTANLLTFLLSSFFHELVMYVTISNGSSRISPCFYLLLLQISQLPLTWIANMPFFRSRPALSNYLFWITLTIGFPLLTIAYCREYYGRRVGGD